MATEYPLQEKSPFGSGSNEHQKPLLEVSELSKTFLIHHLSRQIPVFEGLNFQLEQGQFLRITGANGHGKSTLLRCLYRTYRVTSGKAIYRSESGQIDLANAPDIDIASLRDREIGYVVQFLRPRPRVSALDLVSEPLRKQNVTKEEATERASALLSRFGLNPKLWNAFPGTFSGGEQQRVNLAQGLSVPRRLLLLDEPTASLDKTARGAIHQRLAELKEEGVTMICVFHHDEDLSDLVDDTLNVEKE